MSRNVKKERGSVICRSIKANTELGIITSVNTTVLKVKYIYIALFTKIFNGIDNLEVYKIYVE